MISQKVFAFNAPHRGAKIAKCELALDSATVAPDGDDEPQQGDAV